MQVVYSIVTTYQNMYIDTYPEDLLALEDLLSDEFNNSSHTEFTYTLPNDWNNVSTDGSHTLTSSVSDLTCMTIRFEYFISNLELFLKMGIPSCELKSV